ncbi:MAG: type II toxin-antitoxin system Phd/YefM family antitoxin [Micrococcales bacterium]|nr:type II toxin-antitoxin system Phd/YefM family antitoxin [Micrococcales bacterium]
MEAVSTLWPVQDAKARFSELLDTCLVQGPQTISRRGVPKAVMVPIEQWRQVSDQQPTLKDLLCQPSGRVSLALPKRGQGQHRSVDAL